MSARPPRQVKYGSDARASLAAGVSMVSRTVSPTLGPAGRVVMLDSYFGSPQIEVSEIDRRGSSPAIAGDGYTIAREILTADRFANQGILLAREVVEEVKRRAGDGSTTAVVLFEALIREGIRALASGHHPTTLRRSMNAACERVLELLPGLARPVSSLEAASRVATTAAGGSSDIGRVIAAAVIEHGASFVAFEHGLGRSVSLRLSREYRVDRGYQSPHLINEPMQDRARLESPLVLLVASPVNGARQLLGALELAAEAERPLLLIADEFDADALAMLTVNLQRRRVTAVPIAAPAYGATRRELLEDLAALTGAEIVGGASAGQVADVTMTQLGGAERVLVTRGHTEIEGGHGSDSRRRLRFTQLATQAEEADNAHERDELLARGARLDGKGVARIAVGGSTDSEQRERMRRAEDALRAVHGALEVGVVSGGGATLLRAARSLEADLPQLQETERAGVEAVAAALRAPARTIARNAGCDVAVVVEALRGAAEHETYDVASCRLVDAHAQGIVEPLVVAETAFRAASSVACRILAAEALVVQPLYGERDPHTVREGGPANLTMTRS